MMNRVEEIVDDMKIKLKNYPYMIAHINKNIILPDTNPDDMSKNVSFLLKIACEYNLLTTLHHLLELNLLTDINQPLQFNSKEPKLINRKLMNGVFNMTG